MHFFWESLPRRPPPPLAAVSRWIPAEQRLCGCAAALRISSCGGQRGPLRGGEHTIGPTNATRRPVSYPDQNEPKKIHQKIEVFCSFSLSIERGRHPKMGGFPLCWRLSRKIPKSKSYRRTGVSTHKRKHYFCCSFHRYGGTTVRSKILWRDCRRNGHMKLSQWFGKRQEKLG